MVVGDSMPKPEFEGLVTAAVHSYARYWLEMFRLPNQSVEENLSSFRVDGVERLQSAVDAGSGVVLALPHAGNWDAAAAWVAAKGWPIVTVVETAEARGPLRAVH